MSQTVLAILDHLRQPGASVLELLAAYHNPLHEDCWRADARLYRAFVQALIKAGHPTRAFELGREGLKRHPDDAPLSYFVALALARGGNVAGAAEWVHRLLSGPELERPLKIETLCLEARLFKDRYERSRVAGDKLRHAREAARRYHLACLESGGDWFPGINAAAMSLLADDRETARQLAEQAIQKAQHDLEQGCGDDYWLLATLGEGHFLKGDVGAAAHWYRRAIQEARRRDAVGDIGAMRRQCLLLREKLGPSEEFLGLFHVGNVVVFSGHMLDDPARTRTPGRPARFPRHPDLEERVRAALRDAVAQLNVTVGYCSAACGSDILFAECLLERKPGVELHVVLPFAQEDFCRTSVDFGQGVLADWRDRFEAVLRQATEVHFATREAFLNDEVLFEFVNQFTQGLALLRAAQRGVNAHALVVLDPASEAKFGGTAYFLNQWRRADRPARVVNLAELRAGLIFRGDEQAATPPAVPAAAPGEKLPRQIKAMLFADVKGFSKLEEGQSPRFFPHFMEMVARLLKTSPRPPDFWNTWGDALYVVFDRVPDCAEFALRLRDQAAGLDGTALGLADRTPLRVGVHAGPVFGYRDPLLGRTNYFGSHVNRAARIEPVTMPGCVFASEQFAALLAVEAGQEFVCEYVGVEALAKDFDRCPLFRLDRR